VKAAIAALVLWSAMDRPKIDAAIEAAAQKPLPERIEAMSAGFLGTPYVLSPLGEGQGFDKDPMIRFDAVDCLTFVETTLAMSVAPAAQLDQTLARIRYEAEPSYEGRNHLMEVQWLPNNVKQGFLVDVTRKYGGEDVVTVTKKITSSSWASKPSKELALPRSRQVEGEFAIDIIPAEMAMKYVKAMPTGTVVVVRNDRPSLVTRVSHVGFLIQKKKPTLRHASRTWGKTADEELEGFITRNLNYAKWAVTGFAFFEVQAPTAR
jgi:hypothetical protein